MISDDRKRDSFILNPFPKPTRRGKNQGPSPHGYITKQTLSRPKAAPKLPQNVENGDVSRHSSLDEAIIIGLEEPIILPKQPL